MKGESIQKVRNNLNLTKVLKILGLKKDQKAALSEDSINALAQDLDNNINLTTLITIIAAKRIMSKKDNQQSENPNPTKSQRVNSETLPEVLTPTPEQWKKMTAKERGRVLGRQMINALNNPANHGKTI